MLQTILILLIIAAMSLGVDPLRKVFPEKPAKRMLWAAFSIYVLGNLYFTIFSRTAGTGTYVDPRPFGTYLRMSETIEADFQNATGFAAFFLNGVSSVSSFILNILLYYPMGYLLTVLFPKLKPWQVVLIGCAASCAEKQCKQQNKQCVFSHILHKNSLEL